MASRMCLKRIPFTAFGFAFGEEKTNRWRYLQYKWICPCVRDMCRACQCFKRYQSKVKGLPAMEISIHGNDNYKERKVSSRIPQGILTLGLKFIHCSFFTSLATFSGSLNWVNVFRCWKVYSCRGTTLN